MSKGLRAAFAAAAAALAATVLGGCVVIQEITETQSGIGPVKVTLKLCNSSDDVVPEQPDDTTICTEAGHPTGNNGNEGDATAAGNVQLLVGYRIPAGARAPASLSTDRAGVVLTPSPTYTSELQRTVPAGAGQRWAGYISTEFNQDTSNTREEPMSVVGQFGLPTGAAPFPGPFAYRAVVGARQVTTGSPDPADDFLASRPVSCGDDPKEGSDGAICIDSPSEGAGGFATNRLVPTRDLALLGGGAVTAKSGATTPVAFSAKYAGSGSAGTFAVNAGTNLPRATATPSTRSINPTSTVTANLPVALQVPASAKPGTYAVGLSATLGSERRSAVRTVTVTDGVGPKVSVKGGARKISKKGTFKVKVTCPRGEATRCKGKVRIASYKKIGRRRVSFGSKSFTLQPGKSKSLTFKLSKPKRALLARLGKIKLKASATAKDLASNTGKSSKRFTLKSR